MQKGKLEKLLSKVKSNSDLITYLKEFLNQPQIKKRQDGALLAPKVEPQKTFHKPEVKKVERTISTIADARAAIERIKNSKPSFEQKSEPMPKEKEPTVLEKAPKGAASLGVNTKVFHDKFGKGIITEVVEINSASMYVVEF